MTSKRLQTEAQPAPRLEDVANRAGVSTATVSRAINQPQRVTQSLRQRVLDAVDELGYIPHGAARALASRRSRTIGAIVPTIDNAIFAASLQHLQKTLSDYGYTLLLASSEYDLDREQRECQALVEKNVDGLILVGELHNAALYNFLTSKRVPYANIWVYNESGPHPCIGFDNQKAAEQLTHYLIDIGHSKIAMIAGVTQGNDRATARSTGVRKAISDRQLILEPHLYTERQYTISEGRKAAASFLDSANPPTAIICGNDVLALGALFECLERGMDVPRDISITGYDDLEIASQVSPALTTVQIPSAEMGKLAAEFIINCIEHGVIENRSKLDAKLVIRDSSAPPIG